MTVMWCIPIPCRGAVKADPEWWRRLRHLWGGVVNHGHLIMRQWACVWPAITHIVHYSNLIIWCLLLHMNELYNCSSWARSALVFLNLHVLCFGSKMSKTQRSFFLLYKALHYPSLSQRVFIHWNAVSEWKKTISKATYLTQHRKTLSNCNTPFLTFSEIWKIT